MALTVYRREHDEPKGKGRGERLPAWGWPRGGGDLDANGKRRYVSGRNKPEVKAKLRKLLADKDEGIAYDSENLTVSGYLDRWLDAVKGSVRHRTWQRHEQVVRLHLKPTIGSVRLDRLNALKVQALCGSKLEAGLSHRSVQIVHPQLRS